MFLWHAEAQLVEALRYKPHPLVYSLSFIRIEYFLRHFVLKYVVCSICDGMCSRKEMAATDR